MKIDEGSHDSLTDKKRFRPNIVAVMMVICEVYNNAFSQCPENLRQFEAETWRWFKFEVGIFSENVLKPRKLKYFWYVVYFFIIYMIKY